MTILNALTIINILGCIGDAAFVIGGVAAAKKMELCPFLQLLSGLSTAFFGGIFLRDLLLISLSRKSLTIPAIFGSPLEVAVTSAIGVITIAMLKHWDKKKKLPKIFTAAICFADSIGIVGFAAFGYGRGITAGAPWWIALACAFVTACGGGVIAAVIRAVGANNLRHFTETLKGNWLYYILCFFASVICGVCYSSAGYLDRSLITITGIVIVFGFIVERVKSALC